ncbi:snake venom 5'-nucleotidase-like [Rhopilema esculentum]|uniref:snake venom 5'-nucleotidase-like n=1 Tax=Rhopilema esculentum TaxID=499914 RepID=UPI0031D57A17
MTLNTKQFALSFVIHFALWILGDCFELTILHTNDVHARIEQTNKYGGDCTANDASRNQCFGGVARRQTLIKKVRNTHRNVLLLDAGDQFQGTIWFNVYEGQASAFFMNKLGYDVMTIGNHEFDMGPTKLVEFLRGLKFSVVSSNLDVSREPKWPRAEKLFNRSMIVNVAGEKIGFVGYITKETTWLSYPGDKVKFQDEVNAVRAQVSFLKTQGVNKFIALGHSGIEMDIEIAKSVPDIDIVIGGHTNTFLYTGKAPSNEQPYGQYPLVVNPTERPSKQVLVVQGYTFGKYLGYLNVSFDSSGEITSYGGNPVLLNGSIKEDEEVLNEVKKRRGPVSNYSKIPLGRTHVFLDGQRETCRLQECNIGNLITDAFVHMYQKHPDEKSWADVSIAMWVSGGIRSSIDKKINDSLTYKDIITVLPFGNQADIIELKGIHLMEALEHSVAGYNPTAPTGQFLQVSGIRVQYDLDQPVGKRVVKATVRCSKCRVPAYVPIENNTVYKIIMSTWMRRGGDNFQMFVKHRIKLHPGEDAVRLVAEYIDYIDPIRTGVDERITFVKKPKLPSNCVCNNSKPYTCGGMSSSAPPSLLMLVMILAMSFLVFLYV